MWMTLSSVQQQGAVVDLSNLIVTVYFSSGLRTGGHYSKAVSILSPSNI